MPASPTDTGGAAAGDLLAAALAYAEAGLAVLPLAGKVPRTSNGLTGASTDTELIREWWTRWPNANVGIRTGEQAGVFVLDVDVQHGGGATLKALVHEYGKLPMTATVLTGGGGSHHYFRYPKNGIRNTAGQLGAAIDIRGEGGYCVAPPSIHESGRPYKWMQALERGIAEPPGWLVAETKQNGAAPAVGETIRKGERDSTLASLAGTMRRRGMDEAAILAALRETNKRCKPPLPDRDLERIAASVAGYPSEKEKSEEPFALELMTARALSALPDPPESDQLLGPLLVRGQRLVLGGHTGEGKTTLALALVRAIVLDESFLDWTGSGGRALVVDAEQGLKTIKRRLREAGLAESERVDYVRVPDGLELDSDERHVAAVERVLEAGRYAVVVADPLYKLHSGDSNAEREAVDLMKRFDRWRETFRFALVLPVHCRKPVPGTKFSIHDLFGSSAYVRGAEVVLGLQRVGDGYARLHFLKDRDGDLPIGAKWGLLFDRETGYRRDPKDAGPPTRERVAELRGEDPTLTQTQVAEVLELSERTVRKYWRDEADDGQERLLGDE
jgi:Bifunctional DNA primase/polymerase, N-terminal/AAA domain/Primase C terminal 1 (PriCT-1)